MYHLSLFYILCVVVNKSFNSVQFSHVRLFVTPWITARQASLSITNSRSSPKLLSIELVMPSSHLILCRPLLLLLPIPPSIRVFSSDSTFRMRWPKYWSFTFNISPSNKHPGLISFRMAWVDLLEVQGTLKNLLQNHSSKASILRRSAFFTVQLSHPYITTGKTIALTRRTFVGKVLSLLLVITFLINLCLPPNHKVSSKCLLTFMSGSMIHLRPILVCEMEINCPVPNIEPISFPHWTAFLENSFTYWARVSFKSVNSVYFVFLYIDATCTLLVYRGS